MYVFNYTGHIAMWNYAIEVLSSITEETIRNTPQKNIECIAYGVDKPNTTGLPSSILSLKNKYIKNSKLASDNSCYACDYAYDVWHKSKMNGTICVCCPFNVDAHQGCMNHTYDSCCTLYSNLVKTCLMGDKYKVNKFLRDLQYVIQSATYIRDFPVKNDIPII